MDTPADHTPDSIISAAEKLLASRIEAVRPLADLVAERKRLRKLLEDTEKPYGAAYAAAEAAGWTAEELRQMGAEPPTKRPAGRPRGSRSRSRSSSSSSAPSSSTHTAASAGDRASTAIGPAATTHQ